MPFPLVLTCLLPPLPCRHGAARIQTTRGPRPPPGPGQRGEIDLPLQAEAQHECQHRAHHRLQRGNARGEEERQEHPRDRVGRRRAEDDAGALEGFPPGRGGGGVHRGQLGHGAPGGGAQGAGEHPEERAAAGQAAHPPGQQAGRERSADRHGAQGEVQPEEGCGSGLVRAALLGVDGSRSGRGLQTGGPNGQTPGRPRDSERQHQGQSAPH